MQELVVELQRQELEVHLQIADGVGLLEQEDFGLPRDALLPIHASLLLIPF